MVTGLGGSGAGLGGRGGGDPAQHEVVAEGGVVVGAVGNVQRLRQRLVTTMPHLSITHTHTQVGGVSAQPTTNQRVGQQGAPALP